MDKKKAHYLGTECDGKWWKRYREGRFFARGIGEFWQNKEGLYFLKSLTKEPFFIPFNQIIAVKTGKWHAGRWAAGKDVIKILWQRQGQSLCSGFVFPRGKEEARRFKTELEQKIKIKKRPGEDS